MYERCAFPWLRSVGLVAQGMTSAEILDEYPDLEPEDIRQALQFAAVAVDDGPIPFVDGA